MLGLAETNISAHPPGELRRLKNLDTLAIYMVLLSGPIPPELGEFLALQRAVATLHDDAAACNRFLTLADACSHGHRVHAPTVVAPLAPPGRAPPQAH